VVNVLDPDDERDPADLSDDEVYQLLDDSITWDEWAALPGHGKAS
jgi:hypothetical protein